MKSPLLLIAIVLAFTGPSLGQSKNNLLSNGDFERTISATQPANWQPLIIGAASKFSLDEQEKHGAGGRFSAKIEAPEMARSYWRSDAIPVAPGEKIHVDAWLKVKDAPADHGTVIVIAEFTSDRGFNLQVEKVGNADVKKADWQQVSGVVTVPPLQTNLRLRIGFSYCNGTMWCDDVTVTAEQPLVAHLDLDEPIVTPGMKSLPVTIINRSAAKGEAKLKLMIDETRVMSHVSATNVRLSGQTKQTCEVPLKIVERGKKQIDLQLFTNGGDKPTFSEARTVTVPPPIVLRPVSPTHWVTEDGPPQIEGEVDLALTDEQRRGATLNIAIVSGNEEKASIQISGDLEDRTYPFTIKTQPLPIGDYAVVAQLKPDASVKAEQPWAMIHRAQAQTTINADGYCVHDGKPVFPLGIFNGGAKVKEMGEAGFTVNHAYNAINVAHGERPDDQAAKNFVDNSLKNGMTVCFLIPRGQVFHGDWDAFRKRVRMFRNHPGLLCWDEEEGIARGDMPLESLGKLRQIIHDEDPHHPLVVGDPHDIISRMGDRTNFFPADLMDIGMWWWYPLPLKAGPTTGNALEGEEAMQEPELRPPTFLVKRNTDKPIWVGLQSYKKNPNSRYPTPTEYRAQAYIAVIHDAKGLWWYGGSVNGGIYLDPEEGHWHYLKKLVGELREMSPVFMAKSIAPAPAIEPSTAPISICIKQLPDRAVMLAANRGVKSIDVTMSSPTIRAGDAKVLYEDRAVKLQAGHLSDHFEPMAVHVYELPR